MKSDASKEGLGYFDNISRDARLTVRHISLLPAIVRLACRQNEKMVIRISRSKLMQMSHIDTQRNHQPTNFQADIEEMLQQQIAR